MPLHCTPKIHLPLNSSHFPIEFISMKEAPQMHLARNCTIAPFHVLARLKFRPVFQNADVFCFITNFLNPNNIDFVNVELSDYFDILYLIIKIANNFSRSHVVYDTDKCIGLNENKPNVRVKQKQPIFVADGLVAIDILYSFSKKLPSGAFFCPTPLTTLAKTVLGDYFKVKNYMINYVLAWAADDLIFHLEIEKPLVVRNKVVDGEKCESNMISEDEFELTNMDHTQFNDSWMKKDFIEKVAALSKKNPYGYVFKASKLVKTLKTIWTARNREDRMEFHMSLGVISDGSLGTIKGCPYVLPLILSGNLWSVNKRLENDFHLQGEIKRINKYVKIHHNKLYTYCKNFLEETVINHAFGSDDSSSDLTLVKSART